MRAEARADLLAVARRWVARVGVASALSEALLALEGARIARAAGAEVAGPWEDLLLTAGVPALAHAALIPVIVVVAAFGSLLPIARRPSGRWAWTGAALLVVVPLAAELSTGRRARELSVRAPFIGGVALLAAVLTWAVLPWAVSLGARRRWVPPIVGIGVTVTALIADERVLPRLYPAFHSALVGVAVIGLVLLAEGIVSLSRIAKWCALTIDFIGVGGLCLALQSAARVRWAGRSLATFDNARRIVDERSLWLGRAAALAARRWPPPKLDGASDPAALGLADPLVAAPAPPLAARGRDLMLITVDALRADHVGAYGYSRPTTPHLDALAREGTVFEHAYTPTPHTSYAIASLMSGKYMRPILTFEGLVGGGGGGRRPDETWAGILRAYGFRTAAFYPPAIFFVDADRFTDLSRRGLDFEYAKVEFAAPDLRVAQLAAYLASTPRDRPVFAWVHLFEPHEPYVEHAEHPFGDGDIDRYDSEIAYADEGVGALVATFRRARPDGMVMVTADHGEAFGEHGARYHGTTVYEEQVRVPLVVWAPGLVAVRRVARPVQLIDLLPTVLAASSIPRPPRMRGRDLGALLAVSTGPSLPPGDGVAFSEVDDATMFARGGDRIVCGRTTAACGLYDVDRDPLELHARVGEEPRARELRQEMGALIAASARLEAFGDGSVNDWPDPLRRAFAGDASAAAEVATILDDPSPTLRRRAAEALARLGAAEATPQLERAVARESDRMTRGWLTVARVRISASRDAAPDPRWMMALSPLLHGRDLDIARYAALALAEASARRTPIGPTDRARAYELVVAWIPSATSDGVLAHALLDAVLHLRGAKDDAVVAVPVILPLLDDVRLRAHASRTLGLLGDERAAGPLAERLAKERHIDARADEALALARLGRSEFALVELGRVLGVPELPPHGGEALSETARLHPPPLPGWVARMKEPVRRVHVSLVVPAGASHRLVVVGPRVGAGIRGRIGGEAFTGQIGEAGGVVELEDRVARRGGAAIPVEVDALGEDVDRITAIAIVRRVPDLPPPKADRSVGEPEAGDAGE